MTVGPKTIIYFFDQHWKHYGTQLLCVEPGTNAEAVQPSRAHPNKFELSCLNKSSNLLGCALDGW